MSEDTKVNSEFKDPITIDEMILILQALKKHKPSCGSFKLIHSFNTIHTVSFMDLEGETYAVLEGVSNESD